MTTNINPHDETEKAVARIEAALAASPPVIEHATARLIAAALHAGTGTALQHFAATGQFSIDELGHEVTTLTVPSEQESWRRALLGFLIAQRRRTHPWARGSAVRDPFVRTRADERSAATDALGALRDTGSLHSEGVKYRGNEDSAVNKPAPPQGAQGSTTQDLVLTIPEAAERLRVSLWTIYRLIREGKLQTIQIGTRRLVPLFALQRFLDAETGPKDAAR